MRYSFVALSALTLLSTSLAQSAPLFTPTTIQGVFVEQFAESSGALPERWSPSRATKEEKAGEVFSYVGKWAVESPAVYPGIIGDEGLVLKSKAAHHAISAPFDQVLDNTDKTLVVQYEVKMQKGLECGGAYLKLLTESPGGIQAEEFSDKTPYTIMFGPDRCGSTAKVHFIFRHTSPLTGEVEEKHLLAPPPPKTDKVTTLYTLIVRADQSYEIKVNDLPAKSGSLLEDFSPPVSPPAEIDDITDMKPATWVDVPRIADPEATKPDDWDDDAPATIVDPDAEKPDDWLEDEPLTVPDPEAEKPEEWSDEDDGDFVPPMVPNPKCASVSGCGPWRAPEIPNPEYKGKWFAPLVDNPDYKGPWSPRKIPNPNYYEDKFPSNFNKMSGIGFELWTMTEDILFDNIYIGHSEADATKFAAETFHVKKTVEEAAEAADKPISAEKAMQDDEPDYKKAPVDWVKFKVQQFVNIAITDPTAAFKAFPYVGAALAFTFATLLGLIGTMFSLALPSRGGSVEGVAQDAKRKAVKAKDALKKKTDEVSEDVKEAKEEVEGEVKKAGEEAEKQEGGVRTRAGKGKAVPQ